MASQKSHLFRSQAIEDYAKAIYALELREGEAVSTNALAGRLGVTPASASGMVKRLDELGLHCHHDDQHAQRPQPRAGPPPESGPRHRPARIGHKLVTLQLVTYTFIAQLGH